MSKHSPQPSRGSQDYALYWSGDIYDHWHGSCCSRTTGIRRQRSSIMTIVRQTSSAKRRLALLTVATLSTPPSAKAAERDGTVLFFPLADLQQLIGHPFRNSLNAFLSFSPLVSSCAWHAWSTAPEQANPLQWNTGCGNEPGSEEFHLPGLHTL